MATKQLTREFERKLRTGHSVFDYVVDIKYGSSILMLDKTFSEAKNFLNIIFNGYGKRLEPPIEIHTGAGEAENAYYLEKDSISEISIGINSLREKYKSHVFIHHELPDLLIKNDADTVLRAIQSWQSRTSHAGTVDFYLLPKGTFEEVEKKLVPLTDGVIEINVESQNTTSRLSFTPIGCCREDFHLRKFPYKVELGRLLIEWENEYLEQFVEPSEIYKLIEEYRKDLKGKMVVPGTESVSPTLSVYDYWLLSQIRGKTLYAITVIFPEKAEDLLRKIAYWEMDRLVRVTTTKGEHTGIPATKRVSRSMRLATSMILKLPPSITSRLISIKTGHVHRVPADVLRTSRSATVALVEMLMGQTGSTAEEQMRQLVEMEKRYGEMTTRLTALKRIPLLGEGPNPELDLKYLEKIIVSTFQIGYSITPKVKHLSEKKYEIIISDCALCRDVESRFPVCSQYSGLIEGVCGVVFSRKSSCEEITCRAVGGQSCTFSLALE